MPLPTALGIILVCTPLLALSQSTSNSSSEPNTSDSCQRTVITIIWSCVAVIFTCTWVSVHPNIPGANEMSLNVVRRKISVMIDALIAPELILFWAMRQWNGSRIIEERYKAQGWTKTHGFFLLMGGFVLEEPGSEKPLITLHPTKFHELLVEGQIDFPNVLEEDIQDHSKADWLTKLVVILQVSWFGIQSIARGVSPGIELTELEVVTMAFASLNAAMYFFWWYKPLDVKRAIRVPLKRSSGIPTNVNGQDEAYSSRPVSEKPTSTSRFQRIPPNESAMNVLRVWNVVEKINKIPLLGLFTRPVTSSIWCQDHMIPQDATRMPTFYAPTQPDPMVGTLSMMVVGVAGVLFGAIHFVAWDIHTPTKVELIIWRLFTVAITLTFFATFLNTTILVYKLHRKRNQSLEVADADKVPLPIKVLEVLFGALQLLTVPFYIVGRVVLFILAFSTLRSLSLEARKEIVWTAFIPHV